MRRISPSDWSVRALGRAMFAGLAVASLVSSVVVLGSLAGCSKSARAGGTSDDAGADAGGAAAKTAVVALPDSGVLVSAAAPAVSDAGLEDEVLPKATSDDLTARAKHLVDAIAQDNPELATDIAFPRDAYLVLRDSKNPARGWEHSVNAPFARSVHVLHKRLKGLDRAQFVGIELGPALTQATPKRNDWKKPLWRVRHSHITVTIDGHSQRIDVGEMTGYRGAWYVTKLRGG